MDQAGSILVELGALLETTETLRFDDGCCALQIDGVSVNIQHDKANCRFVISAYISIWPKNVASALVDQILSGNFYWQSGGTICLESQTRSLLMIYPEPLGGLTSEAFLARLKCFVADSHHLRDQVSSFLARPSPQTSNGTLALV